MYRFLHLNVPAVAKKEVMGACPNQAAVKRLGLAYLPTGLVYFVDPWSCMGGIFHGEILAQKYGVKEMLKNKTDAIYIASDESVTQAMRTIQFLSLMYYLANFCMLSSLYQVVSPDTRRHLGGQQEEEIRESLLL